MNKVMGGLLPLCISGALLSAVHAAQAPVPTGGAPGQAMFRANPAHTGAYPTAGVVHLHGVLWIYHTGGAIKSSPAIVGDRVYIGSDDGYLYALTRSTGHRVWRLKTGGAVTSSPAVAQGYVVVASEDGYLYAINAATGRLRWRLEIDAHPAPYDQWDYYISSPVVAEGLVYVGSGAGALYAISIESGRPRWVFRPRWPPHAPIASSPAVAGGRVYIATMVGALYALNARTGTPVWTFHAGDALQSSPTIAGQTLYIGSRDTRLYALNTATGMLRWSVPLTSGSWIVSSPAVSRGVVYVGTSDEQSMLALDAASGRKRGERHSRQCLLVARHQRPERLCRQWERPRRSGSGVSLCPRHPNGTAQVAVPAAPERVVLPHRGRWSCLRGQ